MKDTILLRLLEETANGLEGVSFPVTTPYLIPSYNAILAAAQANHPTDAFLSALTPLEPPSQNDRHNSGGGPEEMRVLVAQLRIVLESYAEKPYSPEIPGGQ